MADDIIAIAEWLKDDRKSYPRRKMFHVFHGREALQIKDLQRLKPVDPRAFLEAEMSARGWRVRDLAERMEGDPLRTRALLWHYFGHPTGELELGTMMADRVGRALGLSGEFLLNLERDYRAVACGHG
jgi:plasmid maintenance system antidote protein VapI